MLKSLEGTNIYADNMSTDDFCSILTNSLLELKQTANNGLLKKEHKTEFKKDVLSLSQVFVQWEKSLRQ